MTSRDKLEFVIGEEKHLHDVLTEVDVSPLLQAALQSGVLKAGVFDDFGEILWHESYPDASENSQPVCAKSVLLLEGEPVGELRLFADKSHSAETLQNMANLLGRSLNSLITGNLKRMLTTEMHTQVVNLSYDELLEANQQLQVSEKKYRDLAKTLDRRVQERTEELKVAYAQLIQQEKMASIGQLAAGIAHEINNPLGFVQSNLNTLKRYSERFKEMLDFYRKTIASIDGLQQFTDLERDERKRLKLAAVEEDMEDLFEESFDGVSRVKKIVSDLKGFSHIDSLGEEDVDIHQEIERSLSVLAHEVPKGTSIIRNFSELPPLTCHGSKLGQLFLNLLRNALQTRTEGLEVTISTAWDGSKYQVAIADNGPGISEDVRARIFEPFFTTRTVGQGTGLGLSVVYDVVKELKGRVRCKNRAEGGAVFEITLPGEKLDA